MSPELITVLVRTESSGNIGASARAMANMEGSRLIIVDPQCSPLDGASRMAAAGAQSFLERIEIYNNWEEFNAAEIRGVKWAFTRRTSRTCPLLTPATAVACLTEPHLSLENPIYLIFGPEKSGLTRNEVECAHLAVELCTFGDFKSLNLSQAVLLALYQVRTAFHTHSTSASSTGEMAATNEQVQEVELLLKVWLGSIGFDWRKRRSSAYKTLRRLMLSAHPTEQDLHVLISVYRKALGPDSALLLKEVIDDLG